MKIDLKYWTCGTVPPGNSDFHLEQSQPSERHMEIADNMIKRIKLQGSYIKQPDTNRYSRKNAFIFISITMQLPCMHTGTSINRTNDNDKLSFFSCYDYDCWVLSTINFFFRALVKRENIITKLTDRFRKWELEPKV